MSIHFTEPAGKFTEYGMFEKPLNLEYGTEFYGREQVIDLIKAFGERLIWDNSFINNDHVPEDYVEKELFEFMNAEK